MRIPGEMEDCTNAIINRGDTLEKRKGFVRGLDERFDGPVCGLFVYTDSCGQEYLLVADSTSVSIRTPFSLPTFTVADCYPSDGFGLADGEPLDEDNWRNTTGYEHQNDAMVQVSGAAAVADNDDTALAGAARWFKDACSTRYKILLQYSFSDPCTAKQRIVAVVRGNGDLSDGAAIYALLEFCTTPALYRVKIVHRDANGQLSTLNTQTGITGDPSGFLELSYDSTTRKAGLILTVDGGASVVLSSAELTTLDDIDLGLVTAIGLSFVGSGIPSNSHAILNVSGESLG